MFPKHTQLQNSTLTIQMPASSVAWLASPPSTSGGSATRPALDSLRHCAVDDGVGIMSGLMPSSTAEPVSPTAADSRKPGLERSMRYHRNGLTSASVSETWSVDAQGSLR